MAWKVPPLQPIEATCDLCGEVELIEPFNPVGGFVCYPSPGDAGARRWRLVPSDAGRKLLCRDCDNTEALPWIGH